MSVEPAFIAVLTDEYVDYRKLIIDQIASVAADSGYGTLCVAGQALVPVSESPGGDSTASCNSIYSQVDRYSPSGLISLTGCISHAANKGYLLEFLNQFKKIPTVSLGISLPGISSVIINDASTMTRLMEHVLQDTHRRRFAFVRGIPQDPYSLEREAIFRSSLLKYGHQVDESLFVEGNYDSFDAYNRVNSLLSRHRDIDAIVAANDAMALSAVRAANSQGLRIPDDIIITGFDDTSHATQIAPAITTVRQPIQEAGNTSANVLLEKIRYLANQSKLPADTDEAPISVDSELIIRGSTTSILTKDELFSIHNVAVLQDQLQKYLSGLPMPDDVDMSTITHALWATFKEGTADLEHCLDSQLASIRPGTPVHWWSNLCHQIEVNISSRCDHPRFEKNRSLIASALAKVRERVWVVSMDQEFELGRQQSIRMNMQLQMSSCTDMPEILDTLERWLSLINATRCFLVQYQAPGAEPDEKAQLIHIYRDQQAEPCNGLTFDSVRVLPEQYIHELHKGLLIQSPVYAGNRLFGYLLLDPNGLELLYIDSVAQSIGNAMRNQYLIRKLEQQTTHLKTANEELEQLATHDDLTGLANRFQFQRHLHTSCDRAMSAGTEVVVYFIDLDGFKLVNDTLGHGAGDELLQCVASRLNQLVKQELGDRGLLARLGGDEFTVVAEATAESNDAEYLGELLLDTLCSVTRIQGQDINLSGSIGLASYPGDSEDVQTLVKHADLAMYRAKANGKHCVVRYSPQLNIVNDTVLQLDIDMRAALVSGDISMHYQPRINLETGEICAVEALMRWTIDTPEGRITRSAPDVFIPVAETTGFITDLDSFALEEGCRQASQWKEAGLPLLVAVNVSVLQLQQENFLNTLTNMLNKYRLDPELLELEITESAVMTDVENNVHKLSEIRKLGIQLSIDDFGTGYSSLNYLKRLPVNNLKIDRSFIADITLSDGGNSVDASIIRSVIALGKCMGYLLIAEGVETEEQHQFIKSLECDQAQGYLYAKPLPAPDITKLLISDRQRGNVA